MAKGLVSDTNLTAIANAIRSKNGSSNTYTPATMATAISNISTVDDVSALQYMLNKRSQYSGIAAGMYSITALPTYTQKPNMTQFDCAFYGCSGLTAITGLRYLSGMCYTPFMFFGCSSLTAAPDLKTMASSDSQSMFQNCTSLTTVSLPDNFVRGNCNGMFQNCSNLTQFQTNNIVQLVGRSSVGMPPYYTASNMFANCSKLTSVTISQIGSSSVYYDCFRMFQSCSKITTIGDTNSDLPIYICGSSSEGLAQMFSSCSALVSVPRLQINSLMTVSAKNMFSGCSKLSNDSLNNIMGAFVSANVFESTLKDIGLSSTLANRCTGLSNWSALSAAGWTTGY